MGNECTSTYCPCWCDHEDEEDEEYLCSKDGRRLDPEGRASNSAREEKERLRLLEIRESISDNSIEKSKSKYASMWRNIVNNSMVGTGVCTKAAIVSQDGQVLAQTKGLIMRREQILMLNRAIHNNPGELAVNGINLGDDNFRYTRSEIGNAVYGVDESGDGGCAVCATKRCLMIGVYERAPNEANNLVEELSEYLKSRDM